MRFRKSVSLMKGVKLNASKSGVSFTVGGSSTRHASPAATEAPAELKKV